MKRFLFFAAVICSTYCAAQDGAVINGEAKGMDGSILVATRYYGDVGMGKFVDTIADGRFSFEMACDRPERVSLRVHNSPAQLFFWIVPGATVSIQGEDNLLSVWAVESGIPQQAAEERFRRVNIDNLRRIDELELERQALAVKLAEAEDDAGKAIEAKMDAVWSTRDSLLVIVHANDIEVMKEMPADETWMGKFDDLAKKIRFYDSGFRDKFLPLYAMMSDEQKASIEGRRITNNIFPPETVGIGDAMFDAELPDLEGKLHRLSDHKGKYILLNFWASGCGASHTAMPIIKKMWEARGDEITIIGINLDGGDYMWRMFSERLGVSWLNLGDPLGTSGIYKNYGITATPTFVIVSPEGKIVESWSRNNAKIFNGNVEKHIGRKE